MNSNDPIFKTDNAPGVSLKGRGAWALLELTDAL